MRRLAPTLVLLLLPGCAGFVGPENDPFAIPRPFAGETRDSLVLASVTQSRSVALGPIKGLPESDAKTLQEQVLALAEARDVLAVPVGMAAYYVLSGRALVAGGRIGIEWELVDQAGREVQSFAISAADGPDAPGALAVMTIDKLAALLSPQSAERAEALTEAIPPPLRLRIGEISGAPGQRGAALSDAMVAILAKQAGRLEISDQPGPDVFAIEARVTIAPVADREDLRLLSVQWRLLDPKGQVLGEIAQANAVPLAQIEQGWSTLSLDIARAAAGGLFDLLSQLSVQQRR